MKDEPTKYTLVQHSGIGHDEGFAQAVQEQSIIKKSQAEDILEEGGLVFDSYEEASEAAIKENYPDEVKGLYPKVRGHFSTTLVGGYKLYIPARRGALKHANKGT